MKSVIPNKKLDELRAVILAECKRRMARDHQLCTTEVAEWLVRHDRQAVIGGLVALICQVMEQWEDDNKVEDILRAKPELRELTEMLRSVSQDLRIPLWFLLEANIKIGVQCSDAALLISQLRLDARVRARDAMVCANDFLRPITEAHPEMTAEEAFRELQRQTDETIHKLEPPLGQI